MNHGEQSFRKGLLQESAASFARAVEMLPTRHEGWINLGSALLQLKQFGYAVQSLQKAISINPDVTVAHMMLGDALRLQGKTARSIDCYTKAVSLQRTPMALNKLACALRARSRVDEAEDLYREAERVDPSFSLARVNRATMQIECQRYSEAHRQLSLLVAQALPPEERREVETALHCIAEHARLQDAIDAMAERGDLAMLEARLRETPPARLRVDRAALGSVEAFAGFARSALEPEALQVIALPEEWPLIEAMHMIPLVDTVEQYLAVRETSAGDGKSAADIHESLRMAPAIRAARACRDDMMDPVKAELHLRYWHALASQGVEGLMPGHFKYTQNWAARNPTLTRVNPSLCSGTIRYLISDIYSSVPPGLLRAAIAFLGIFDPHPFADGNARIGMIWLNRELEWAGLMPALFSRELGFRGQLGAALKQIRNSDGDLAPLLAVIVSAQRYARDFCIELAGAAQQRSD